MAVERGGLTLRTRVVWGVGAVSRLGELARAEGFTRVLLVADPGLVAAGHVARAEAALDAAGLDFARFSDFGENPDGLMCVRGLAAFREADADALVALGGGSSLDCAKGIGFLATGGGRVRDYRGWAKARRPLPPMIGVPTTAGTGSEAQSYALLSDEDTHEKLACGDPSAAFRVAVLDPELCVTAPRAVTATAGFDALSHAVESYVTSVRSPFSDLFAREAFTLLARHYARVLEAPQDVEARGAMLMGSFLAGSAIEQSMLGAAHACANPLTARYGVPHGEAIALMLPHVVRFNAAVVGARYASLLAEIGESVAPQVAGEALALRLETLARLGDLPRHLRERGVSLDAIPALAEDAATQWTGTHNPRPFDAAAARELYACAL
ncbi:MAG: iron-containing alcohol dehydrogenase [Vicinamibacteria bacterium]|nr:iron-containing alcohol dehydrogenase [Vicinamibacteria bacterium]